MNPLDALNTAPIERARLDLERCCGAHRWVERMLAHRPFRSPDELLALAEREWWTLDEADFLEAFGHHPKIGDVESLRKRFATTASWASAEQSGMNAASEQLIQNLSASNRAYEDKFGFIFIVCATGKSAADMFSLLQSRLPNERATEIQNAAAEQAKITAIRLRKLVEA